MRAIIVVEKGAAVTTFRSDQVSGSLSLPQPRDALELETVVRITLESGG